jgi:uncharacterized protein DUF4168
MPSTEPLSPATRMPKARRAFPAKRALQPTRAFQPTREFQPTRALQTGAALASLAALFLTPVAVAQSQPPGGAGGALQAAPPAAPAPSSPAKVTDRQLNATAAAIREVTKVRQSYSARINSAPPSGKEQIIGEANLALAKAVTDQGLTVDEYNAILLTAQTDARLRQRLVERLQSTVQ